MYIPEIADWLERLTSNTLTRFYIGTSNLTSADPAQLNNMFRFVYNSGLDIHVYSHRYSILRQKLSHICMNKLTLLLLLDHI